MNKRNVSRIEKQVVTSDNKLYNVDIYNNDAIYESRKFESQNKAIKYAQDRVLELGNEYWFRVRIF